MAEIVCFNSMEAHSQLLGASCAFGVFDGVHKGHRFIIEQAKCTAVANNTKAVVLTFDRDPDELFYPQRLHKLLSNEKRIETLAGLGVNAVVVLHFSWEFASHSPLEFLEDTFSENLPAHIHVGQDFRFGSHASGDLSILEEWGRSRGMVVHGHDLLNVDGAPITATRIRLLLEQGFNQEAYALLGYSLEFNNE